MPVGFKNLEKVDWKRLTPKDITQCDSEGKTLLHHAAAHGFWNRLPNELKDRKYWIPSSDGTTIPMYAMASPDPNWLEKEELKKDELTKKNTFGEDLLSTAIKTGNLNKIPRKLLTQEVLKTQYDNQDTYLHLIAKEEHINDIPTKLLSEELLSLKGNYGMTCYHILAENNQLSLIPKNLLTPKALTIKNNYGISPLSILVGTEDPIELIPQETLKPEIFLKKEGKEAPIFGWVNGRYWMNIPPEFITKESLKLKGTKTLLHCLLQRYAMQAVWFSKNDKELKNMLKLVKKSLSLGDAKELESIRKRMESLEKGDSYPNGIKKVSTLVNEEARRRKTMETLQQEPTLTL
jgi:hypothetical protein